MRTMIVVVFAAILAVAGCGKKESGKPAPEKSTSSANVKVELGDSYDDVIDKLGKPNLESVGQHSRVLIYDRVELKLQSNAVVEVYDYRGK